MSAPLVGGGGTAEGCVVFVVVVLPLEEAWWPTLTLAEVTSGNEPVKRTEKLMRRRVGL